MIRLGFIGLILAGAAGCEDSRHQDRLARREDNLQRTCNMLSQQEAERPALLAKTLNMLQEKHERDIERCRDNPRVIRDYFQRDIDRWNEGQPYYLQGIQHQTEGDCDNIEDTLPLILY